MWVRGTFGKFNLQNMPVVTVSLNGSSLETSPHQGARGHEPTLPLTSPWTKAWARDGWQPWREVLAWRGMRRSSDPRSPPFCAVAPSPRPPASRSLWGRTLPCHGWTVRTLQALLRPGVRCPPPLGGRGLERWMAGSETSSWWMPQREASAAHSSSLSGKTHRIEIQWVNTPKCPCC